MATDPGLLGKANWWLPSWLARLLPSRAETLGGNEPAAEAAEVR